MRRTLLALVLACGFGLPLATLTASQAHAETTGPVAFIVHAATCPLDDVYNPDIGLYDACHDNGVEGVTFTLASLEEGSVSFTTDADGIGSTSVLNGLSAVSQLVLSVDPAAVSGVGGYVYCADQVSGTVLYDGTMINGGIIPLFTIDSSQQIVCDWYLYTDSVAAG